MLGGGCTRPGAILHCLGWSFTTPGYQIFQGAYTKTLGAQYSLCHCGRSLALQTTAISARWDKNCDSNSSWSSRCYVVQREGVSWWRTSDVLSNHGHLPSFTVPLSSSYHLHSIPCLLLEAAEVAASINSTSWSTTLGIPYVISCGSSRSMWRSAGLRFWCDVKRRWNAWNAGGPKEGFKERSRLASQLSVTLAAWFCYACKFWWFLM